MGDRNYFSPSLSSVSDFLPVEGEEKKVEEQTEFLVSLVKFADDSKIKVIKEIKSVLWRVSILFKQESLLKNCYKL